MKRIHLGLLFVLVATGSACGTKPLDGTRFVCSKTEDCAEGFVCLNGECVRPGTQPGCAAKEICDNGADDDCDNLVDCADTDCGGQGCGLGRLCGADNVCACSPNAPTRPPGAEAVCGDRQDDDCDGQVDCADTDCLGQSCGSGTVCVGQGSCQCVVDGGTAEVREATCGDALDNDCDGQVDCADSDCATCGANGQVCQSGACVCSGNGGVAEPTGENTCGDGTDNDCNGQTDCSDTSCDQRPCSSSQGFACVLGACVCNGNGGAPQPNGETACSDTRDNDCDGLVDCADTNCAARTCGTNGRVCSGTTCACSGNGGTAQAAETTCNDNADNDCDGLVDCADPNCAQQACGSTTGFICTSTSATGCTCGGRGGAAQASELTCNDGFDNDCDGLVDCADTGCNTRTCAVNGRVCSAQTCVCSGNGGTAQGSETVCGDGFDNDCDGLVDCADSTCNARACGGNGLTCAGGTCACTGNGGVAQATETTCGDGIDNDCDGLVDCADPHCSRRTCSATPGFVCTSTSPTGCS
ncbi:MAG TPA: MopE-related protein, partial [Myxococcaceae bacterium]|nr:MopE-related protein [Myxococcaceae bacterium]